MLKEVVEQDENVLTPRSLKGRLSFLDLVILVNLGGLGASMAVCFMPAPLFLRVAMQWHLVIRSLISHLVSGFKEILCFSS
jgi:hypothetical protein